MARKYKNLKYNYQKYLHKFMKFIPLIGIILLFGIYWSQHSAGVVTVDASLSEKLLHTVEVFKNSFYFSDRSQLAITIILLITLWTGYKYWLKNQRYIHRNSRLLEKLIIVIMVIIFVNYHIRLDSLIGKAADWALFLLSLYLTVAGSWFLAKTIDGINLRSDLYCWGLRLIGGLVIFFGVIILTSSALALTLSNSKLVFNNIYWILGICIILLGAFMEYRSLRRHPAIHVW